MCRKKHLQGCCCIVFALGVMIGHSLESWFLCCCGGIVLIVLGLCIIRQR
ncbi:MAG: hypothetical protein Q4F17_03250 [Eubacteriales bacterium]|nr:hypothetical protein [Eubacteriales bacterium]